MKENIESATVPMDSGKDVKSTSQLSGLAKPDTKAQTATNSPTKYSTGSLPATGPLGGKNRRH